MPKSYKSEGNHDVGMFNCISHATSTYSIPHVTCLYNLTTSDLQVRTEMLDKYLMLMWYWHDNKAGQCLQVPGICGICGIYGIVCTRTPPYSPLFCYNRRVTSHDRGGISCAPCFPWNISIPCIGSLAFRVLEH